MSPGHQSKEQLEFFHAITSFFPSPSPTKFHESGGFLFCPSDKFLARLFALSIDLPINDFIFLYFTIRIQ